MPTLITPPEFITLARNLDRRWTCSLFGDWLIKSIESSDADVVIVDSLDDTGCDLMRGRFDALVAACGTATPIIVHSTRARIPTSALNPGHVANSLTASQALLLNRRGAYTQGDGTHRLTLSHYGPCRPDASISLAVDVVDWRVTIEDAALAPLASSAPERHLQAILHVWPKGQLSFGLTALSKHVRKPTTEVKPAIELGHQRGIFTSPPMKNVDVTLTESGRTLVGF